MAPITWRNVDAPSLGDPSRTLGMAQGSFNTAFDVLGSLLGRQEATNDRNWQATKDANTNQVLNIMANFKTPDEAQAALANGDVAALMASMGAQVDQNKIRATQTSLVDNLQRKALTGQAYQDQQRDISERDQVGQISALTAGGKFQDAIDAVHGSTLSEPTKARLIQDVTNASRQQDLFGMKKTELDLRSGADQRAERLADAQISQMEAAANASNAAARASANKTVNQKDVLALVDERGKPIRESQSNNPFGTTAYDSKDGRTDLETTLKGTGTFATGPSSSSFADQLVAELAKDGVVSKDRKSFRISTQSGQVLEVPITAEVLRRAINDDNGMLTDPRVGSTASRVSEYLKSPEAIAKAAEYSANKAALAALEGQAYKALSGGDPKSVAAIDVNAMIKELTSPPKQKPASSPAKSSSPLRY